MKSFFLREIGLGAALLLLAMNQPAACSAETTTPYMLSAVTIADNGPGYRIEVELKEKGGLKSVAVTYKGSELAMPESELPPGMADVDLRQAQLRRPDGPMDMDRVILVIPFDHEFRKDPKGGEDLRVSNVVRLLFRDGKFHRWEMAVSAGEESGAWKLSYKDAGAAIEDNGREDGLTNPYWSWNVPSYATGWEKSN